MVSPLLVAASACGVGLLLECSGRRAWVAWRAALWTWPVCALAMLRVAPFVELREAAIHGPEVGIAAFCGVYGLLVAAVESGCILGGLGLARRIARRQERDGGPAAATGPEERP